MTAPTVLGLNAMTLTGQKKSWSKKDSELVTEIYEGPLAKAQVLYDSLKLDTSVSSLDLDPQGVSAILSVTKPDPNQELNEGVDATWELEAIEVMKDLRSHPYFTQSLVLASDIARCDRAIENGTAYDAAGAGIPNVMKRYYALREAGVETYFDSALMLRKTLRVGGSSTIKLAYSDMNRVVTRLSIAPPSALLGALSALPVLSYNGDNPVTSLTITYGDWEWLKKGPKCKSAGHVYYDLIQEWIGLDAWSKVLYGGTWDPITP